MSFDKLGLAPRLLARLADLGLAAPTPIQEQAIPVALDGRDVIGLAQTGTGKTLAFGLPLIDTLARTGRKPEPNTARGLVLAPTRELAKQIADSLRPMTEGTHLKVQVVVGGAALSPQIKRLQRGTDLLVATPGRLLDLVDRRAVRLDETKFLVLDEADQMLDLGFIHALRRIAPLLSPQRQTMLFSATMPKQMDELSRAYVTDPVRVQVAPPGRAADKIAQSIHYVEKADKTSLLIEELGKHPEAQTLVFGRTKHGSDRLAKHLERAGFAVAAIHGNRSQGQRDRAIRAFRGGEIKVLVATDVAARGIDIPTVAYVYNYELPNVAENYIHRIGRTARAGRDGVAVAFCAPDEMGELRDIEKVLTAEIPVAGGTRWEEPSRAPKKPARGKGRGRRPGGGGGDAGGAGKSRRPRRRKARAA